MPNSRKKQPNANVPLPAVRGRLGVVREGRVGGWATFVEPDLAVQPVRIAIYVNDKRRVVLSADRHRPDLKRKGISKSGYSGFLWQPPKGSKLSPGDQVRALVVNSTQELANSPARIPDRPPTAPIVDRSSGEATVVFVHVPKTAGTTIRQLLMRQYPEVASRAFVYPEDVSAADWVRDVNALANLEPERKSSLRCVAGHFHFGVHRRLEGPVAYITLLRHPLERVLSLYHHVSTFHRQQPVLIPDWVAKNEQARNHQTRILAGSGRRTGGSALMARALSNIDKHFALVGLTERFDESILLVAEKLGWAPPYYVRDNVSAKKPKLEELTPNDKETILEANQLDIELFAHVRRRLEESIDSRGNSFQDLLERFRCKNKAAGKQFRPLATWNRQSPSRDHDES